MSKRNINDKCELCENDYDLDYASIGNFNNSRKIFVLIPEGYELNKDKYPLLVVHDGRAVFYSKNGGFGKRNKLKKDSLPKPGWNLDETVHELIQSKKIKKTSRRCRVRGWGVGWRRPAPSHGPWPHQTG